MFVKNWLKNMLFSAKAKPKAPEEPYEEDHPESAWPRQPQELVASCAQRCGPIFVSKRVNEDACFGKRDFEDY